MNSPVLSPRGGRSLGRTADGVIQGSPPEATYLPIVPVWGVTLKVWPAHDGNAVFYRECTIPMDASWGNVKMVIRSLLELKEYIPEDDQGWSARFWRQTMDDTMPDNRITEF